MGTLAFPAFTSSSFLPTWQHSNHPSEPAPARSAGSHALTHTRALPRLRQQQKRRQQRLLPAPVRVRCCAGPDPLPPWAEQAAPLFDRARDPAARVRAFVDQPRAFVTVRPLAVVGRARVAVAWLAPAVGPAGGRRSHDHPGAAGWALGTPLDANLDRALFEQAIVARASGPGRVDLDYHNHEAAAATGGGDAWPPEPAPSARHKHPSVSAADAALLLLRARDFVAKVHKRARTTAAAPPPPPGRAAALETPASADLRSRSSSDVFAECVAEAAKGSFSTSLDLFAHVCQKAGKTVLCASIEEVESLEDDSALTVAGYLYVTSLRRLYGEDVTVGDTIRVKCSSPAFASAISASLNVSCHVPRYIFDSASCRYTVEQDGRVVIIDDTTNETDAAAGAGRAAAATGTPPICAVAPWDVTYTDAMALSDASLRASLRAERIMVHSQESRRSLMLKFADLMDEVERRELLIKLAAEDELWGLAAELQRGRSDRGKLVHRMRAAEDRADWDEVFRLKCEVDRMKSCIADPTQDPGSYDPYLDQDPWYKPSR